MKAYEAAKLLKIPNKEFLQKYEIKSHLSKLPEDLVAELFGEEKKIEAGQAATQTVDSAETDVVVSAPEKTEEECPYTVEQVARHIKILGNKSPAWKWRHIVDA